MKGEEGGGESLEQARQLLRSSKKEKRGQQKPPSPLSRSDVEAPSPITSGVVSQRPAPKSALGSL